MLTCTRHTRRLAQQWHSFATFFFSSRRRHTRYWRDWSSDVCSSDLPGAAAAAGTPATRARGLRVRDGHGDAPAVEVTAVQLADRLLRLLRRVHLDEAEAPRLAGEAIGDDGRRLHVPALGEELAEPFAGRRVRQPAD